MRSGLLDLLRSLAALLVMGAASAVGGPEPSPAALSSVEGIVRLAGAPTAARVEVRRLPGEPPPGLGPRDPSWEDEDADPTQSGVVESPPLEAVSTDEGGGYRLEGLASGRYEIRASTPSGARAFAGLLAEGGRALVKDLAISPGSRSFRGRLLWADGRPFRGTVVIAQPWEGRRATPWLDGAEAVATDPEGRFEVGGLLPGAVEVSAVVPGRLRLTWTREEAPTAQEMTFVLDRGLVEYAGRVTTPDGDPIRDVPLACRTAFDDGTQVCAVARTDGEGRFHVPVAPGPKRLHVRAFGFLPDATVAKGSEEAVRLARAPVVRGVVRRKDDGRPVEGAWVHVAVRRGWGRRTTSGRTDAAGRYEIVSATLGKAYVVVQGGGWVAVDAATETRRLESGSLQAVDFEALPAARVHGRVVSEDGTAVAGAILDLRLGGEGAQRARGQEVIDGLPTLGTDRDGRFVVEGLLPDASVRISARGSHHPWGHADAMPGSTVSIALDRHPPILGRVALPADARPSNVWLRASPAVPAPAPGAPPRPESPPLSSLDVGPDGSFRIEPGEAGPYTLRASAWIAGLPYEGTVVGAPGKGDVVVSLEPAGRTARGWLFRVLDPDGHRILDGGATVYDVGPGFSGSKWTPIHDGEVAYWSERADTRVTAELTDFLDAAGRPLPYAVAKTESLPPGVHEVRLRLGRVVRGRVRTPDGTPVPHAEVSAYPVGGDPDEHRADAWAETDTDGRFELRNLERRDYVIEVRPPEGMSPVAPTAAPVGAEEVDVTMFPLVRARIEVRTADGRAVEGARVVVWGPTDKGALSTGALDLRTGADGSVTLSPLPPLEAFDLRVDPSGEDALSVERSGWRPEATVLQLPRGDVLSGAVRDPAGHPVPNATVWVRAVAGGTGGLSPQRAWWRIRDGYALAATSGAEGAFSIGRLVPGQVELFAALASEDGGVRESAPVTAPTSSREVLLTIQAR